MGTYRGSITQTIKTLSDLDNASLGEIQTAVRNLKKEMRNVTSEDEYAAWMLSYKRPMHASSS